MADIREKLARTKKTIQEADNPNVVAGNLGEVAQVRGDIDTGQSSRARRAEPRIRQKAVQEVEIQNQRLIDDFGRLQEGKVDEVRDWKQIAEATIHIAQQGDEDAEEIKNALLWQYGDQLKPHIEAAGGEKWWEENYTEPPEEETSILGRIAQAGGGVMEYLDQWGQEGLSAVSGLRAAIHQGDDISAGEGLAHALRSGARGLDLTKAIPGTDWSLGQYLQGDANTLVKADGTEVDLAGEDGRLDAFEAWGFEEGAGGKLGGALALLAEILVDPTTYMTLGTGALARAGMKAAEETAQELGGRAARDMISEFNQRIADKGWRSLDEAEQGLYDYVVKASTEHAAEAGGRAVGRFQRDLASQRLRAIQLGGQSGLRVAGVTVLPTGRLSSLARRLGVTGRQVFERAPREALQQTAETLTGDARLIADEIIDPDVSLIPLDEAAEEAPNWQFYNGEGDMINVVAPDGRTLRVAESEVTDLMAFLSDMEIAYLARQNPVVGELLPAARRRVVRGLIEDDIWEGGLDGIRQITRTGDDIATTGVAGELPAGTSRLSREDAAAELRNAPRRKNPPAPTAPGGRLNPIALGEEGVPGNLPVPKGPQGVARAMDNVTDPGWRFADEVAETGTDIVPAPKGDLVPVELTREADELLDEVAEQALGDIDPKLQAKMDAVGHDIIGISFDQGWFGRLMEIPKIRRVVSAMSPRAYVRARFGSATAQRLGELLSVTRATSQARTADILTRVGGDLHKGELLQAAIREAGGKENLFRMLDDALANPARMDELLSTVGEQQGRLLRSLASAREEIFEATLRGQGYTPDEIARMVDGTMELPSNMHDLDTYIPRVLTGVVRNDADFIKKLRNLTDDAGTVGGRGVDSLAEGFLNKRSLAKADSVFDANSEMAAALREAGIEAPEQMFETNIPAAFAVRSKSAFEAAAEVDLLDGITELTGPGGSQLAYRMTPEDVAGRKLGEVLPAGVNRADFQRIELPSGVSYYVQKDIAAELENVRRVFGDPKTMNAAVDLYDTMNNVWAMSATVGLVNPGFHIRNMIGNWFNMVIGGVRDVKVIPRANQLQGTNRRIRNTMAEQGVDYAEAARLLDVDSKDLKILEGARRTGVLGDSRTLDLTRAEGGRQTVAPTEQTLGSRLNPASPDSVINRPGVLIGERIEGNARLAMYIDQLNKGATPNSAAAHVKQHLFDYGDLTRFENEQLRRISRFYTFTRKNTALQFYAITRYPGRVANAQQIIDGAVEGALDPIEGEDGELAEGAVPEWMQGAAVGTLAGTDIRAALDVDTTWSSAEDMVTMFTDLLAPTDPLNPNDKGAVFFEKFDSLFSGVGVSFMDFWNENLTGEDSFTGRPLGGDRVRDNFFFRAIEVALPAASRAERLAAQSGADIRENDAGRDWELMALNWLGGLQVAELDDDATGSQRSVLIRELMNLQDEMRDEYGAYDPDTNPDGMMTLSQLRQNAELNEKDRIMTALLYAWEQGPDGELVWSENLQMDRVQEVVPKEVLQAFGIEVGEDFRYDGARDRAETDDEEVLAQRDERDLATAMEAFELWRGEPLTEEEKVKFLVSSPWAPSNTMLEDLGIEPYRPGNRFVEDGEAEPSYADQLSDAETALTRLAEAVGLDATTLASFRPRMSRFQRVLEEAQEAGVPLAELQDYITLGKDEGGGGVLSRNDRVFINQLLGYEDRMNGLIQVSETRTPDVTPEDQRKIAEKAWEAEEEYILFSQLYGLPRPSQEQVEAYVANSIMTSGTLEDLGYVDLKGAKNRKDDRTEAEQYEDSLSVQEAMNARGPRAILFGE